MKTKKNSTKVRDGVVDKFKNGYKSNIPSLKDFTEKHPFYQIKI